MFVGKPIPFGNASQNITKVPAASNVSKSISMTSGFVSKSQEKDVADGVPDFRRLDISPITSVDEFCPDGGHLAGFLDDIQFNAQGPSRIIEHEESDS